MKLSKQTLCAMIIASIVATTFSVSAMADPALDSIAVYHSRYTPLPEAVAVDQEKLPDDWRKSLDGSTSAAVTQAQSELSSASDDPLLQQAASDAVFLTEPVEYDGVAGVAITGFYLSENNYETRITVPPEIGGLPVLALKNTNANAGLCMTGADAVTSLDLSQAVSLKEIDRNCFRDASQLSSLLLPTEETSGYTIGDGAFYGCAALSGAVDLSRCSSVGVEAFFFCTQSQPILSVYTDFVQTDAFFGVPVITIEAPDETTLSAYCGGISSNGARSGLVNVKKTASLPGVSDLPFGWSVLPVDLAPDTSATYFLSAIPDSSFSMEGYHPESSSQCILKSVPNGETASAIVDGTVKVTFTLPFETYDSTKTYRLSVNGRLSEPLSFTAADSGYVCPRTIAISGEQTMVALVSEAIPESVSVTGNSSVTFGDNNNLETFSAAVMPVEASQTVRWVSSDPSVLSFDDVNSNVATVHKAGSVTVQAVAAGKDGRADVVGTLDVVVNSGRTPNAVATGYSGTYDGQPHSITLTNLLEGSVVEYSTDQVHYSAENPTFTDVCHQTVYYQVTNPNDTDVYRSQAVVEITPALVPTPPASECSVSFFDAIAPRETAQTKTEEGDSLTVLYGVQTPGSADIFWQTSPVFTGLQNKSGYNFYIQYQVDEPKAGNYTNHGNAVGLPNSFTVGENNEVLKSDDNGATWTDESGNRYADGYGIPFQFQAVSEPEIYQVELSWGTMQFQYNFGVWNPDTLSYDDPDSIGWGDSFDGVQNQLSVINRSTQPVDVTVTLNQDTSLDLGFQLQLVKNNAVKDDITNPSISGVTNQLTSGNLATSSLTAYVNLTNENDKPSSSYDAPMMIGTLTVSVQKST